MGPPVAGNEVALLPSPILQPAAALEVSTPTLQEEKPTDRGLSLLLFALKTRELSLIDKPIPMARVKPVVTARPARPRAPRAPRPAIRIRWGRVAFRGLSLGVIAAALVVLPPEQVANVLNEASSTVAQVSSTIGSTITEKLAEDQ